ncbi:MAG: bifunctional riboflavin kinase/FAD synthetase [Acidobacteria bacterium]|nr:bifunctional riboflavin kinase/FAD synthetase [Acidobacteriota bacterium]
MRKGLDVIYFPDDARPARWYQPVLAIGNFDGLHRGHLKIVERVCRRAGERGATPVALTFDPHPPRIVRPDKAPPLLMTLPQKLEGLAHLGIHGVAIVRFTEELSMWEPELFVRRVLVDWLRISEAWVGANFLFGHNRAGNFSLLRLLGARDGFRAEKIDPVRYKEFVVSSTRIRRLISEGRVDEAGALLGHHYAVDGAVLRGDGRGRQMGFPTANICTDNELVPPRGVYAATATVGEVIYPAVTNIGVRPTFGDSPHETIESHIFRIDRDLYGERLRLAFVQRLRDERRFDSADTLRAQIEADCRHARELFDRISL